MTEKGYTSFNMTKDVERQNVYKESLEKLLKAVKDRQQNKFHEAKQSFDKYLQKRIEFVEIVLKNQKKTQKKKEGKDNSENKKENVLAKDENGMQATKQSLVMDGSVTQTVSEQKGRELTEQEKIVKENLINVLKARLNQQRDSFYKSIKQGEYADNKCNVKSMYRIQNVSLAILKDLNRFENMLLESQIFGQRMRLHPHQISFFRRGSVQSQSHIVFKQFQFGPKQSQNPSYIKSISTHLINYIYALEDYNHIEILLKKAYSLKEKLNEKLDVQTDELVEEKLRQKQALNDVVESLNESVSIIFPNQIKNQSVVKSIIRIGYQDLMFDFLERLFIELTNPKIFERISFLSFKFCLYFQKQIQSIQHPSYFTDDEPVSIRKTTQQTEPPLSNTEALIHQVKKQKQLIKISKTVNVTVQTKKQVEKVIPHSDVTIQKKATVHMAIQKLRPCQIIKNSKSDRIAQKACFNCGFTQKFYSPHTHLDFSDILVKSNFKVKTQKMSCLHCGYPLTFQSGPTNLIFQNRFTDRSLQSNKKEDGAPKQNNHEENIKQKQERSKIISERAHSSFDKNVIRMHRTMSTFQKVLPAINENDQGSVPEEESLPVKEENSDKKSSKTQRTSRTKKSSSAREKGSSQRDRKKAARQQVLRQIYQAKFFSMKLNRKSGKKGK